MDKIQKYVIFVCATIFIALSFFTAIIPAIPLALFIPSAIVLGIAPFAFSLFMFTIKKGKEEDEVPTPPITHTTKKQVHDKGQAERLDTLVNMTENRLFKITSVPFFDLFPDEVIIELKQVVIVTKNFFYAKQEHPIAIGDILAPVVESSVLFAKLRIELGPGGFDQNPPSVSYLRKSQAIRAKRIIMGLVICAKEQIDLSHMNREEILERVEQIGSAQA